MNATALPEFWEMYERLPERVQELADRCFETWKANPWHPGIRFKELRGGRGWWSARVGLHHRAVCIREAEDCVWFFIGSHAEYDALIR